MVLKGIHVIQGKQLSDGGDAGGKADPYFVCRIGSFGSTWNEKKKQTNGLQIRGETIRDEKNPRWNAKFTVDTAWIRELSVSDNKTRFEMTLKIWDKDTLFDDDLGSVVIEIPHEDHVGPKDYPIVGGKGSVTVEFFKANSNDLSNWLHCEKC